MIWLQFSFVAVVIVLAGVRLARYGDMIGEKTGLGRHWTGAVLLAATTSLPELFSGVGATAFASLPDIAVIIMNAPFLLALTSRVLAKRFVVSWDMGTIALV